MGFIGVGRITRIFLQALKNKSVELEPIVVFDPDSDVCSNLKEDLPEIRIVDSMEEAACRRLIVLAVHPPVLNVLKPENQDLMKYYGVATIPTQILLDQTGQEFFRHSGYYSTEDLEKQFVSCINGE